MMQDLKIRDSYEEKYGFRTNTKPAFETEKGLSEEVIKTISDIKQEPEWLRKFRARALAHFMQRAMPKWGADLSQINFGDIIYYVNPSDRKQATTWEEVSPEIKKTFDLLGVPEAERKFLAGVGAQFECLTGDSKIFTNPKGLLKLTDVKSGDFVFSLNENTRLLEKHVVKSVMPKGERPVYEMTVGTRKIRATENHPFLALSYEKRKIRRKFKLQWKFLGDLKEGDFVAIAKDFPDFGRPYEIPSMEISTNWRHNKIKLPKITDENLMWFLGIYLGDGFIHKGKKKARVEIAIPDSDSQLREELSLVVRKIFDINVTFKDKYRVTVNSIILAKFIEHIGFYGKAKTKSVPDWIYSLPKSQILAFLGGYVDSDGYVRDHKKNHDIVLTSANMSILENTKNLALLCGIQSSTIHKVESTYRHKGTSKNAVFFRMELSGNFEKIGCRSQKRLERFGKKKSFHTYTHGMKSTFTKHTSEHIGFAKIKSIKYAGVEFVYDIEIDGPHNFVANGIIAHNSENVYHSLQEQLKKQGVIFVDPDTGLNPTDERIKNLRLDKPLMLKAHEMFRKWFGKVVPIEDNKFASLNSAVFSGGSFIYIPKGVDVAQPLQAYFRINRESMGQFERTLIIADEGSKVHYIEGCTAAMYRDDKQSLHTAVVEIVALPGSQVRYTTLQNWSNNVYNLVTKRAYAYEGAAVEWLDANIGSRVTMKFPSVYMMGANAKADILSVAYAGKGQHQDSGGKALHFAPNTTSKIISKSVSKDGGRCTYRGLLHVAKGAANSKSTVRCDALLLDEQSRTDTYPYNEINNDSATITHEASVGKIGEDLVFYLMSRGLTEQEALSMVVNGFLQIFTKELPMEYAIEFNRLIQLEMSGAVG